MTPLAEQKRAVQFRMDAAGMADRPFEEKPIYGTARYTPGRGWKFITNVSSHRSSRKFHSTLEACLPRWIGYPDRCCSQEMWMVPR